MYKDLRDISYSITVIWVLKKYEMLPKSSHYNFLDMIHRDYTIDNFEKLEEGKPTRLFEIPFVDETKRD
jgi:hypothetical protein